jgi:hypothetical protein
MVRRRSTVRFRKGAPQVRRVFCLPVRRPLPIQGEGPQFYSEAKAQVRADVSLLRGCGTVPVGRKISTIASLTGSFALARARPPSSVQCRWGANWGARSSSGGPEVSWPRPAGGPWSRSGNSARWPRLLAFGVPACRWPLSLRSGPATITTEDRQGAGLEDLRHVDGVGALVDAEAGWRGADRLLACGSAASPGGDRVAS